MGVSHEEAKNLRSLQEGFKGNDLLKFKLKGCCEAVCKTHKKDFHEQD